MDHERLKVGSVDAAMAADGFIGLDMSGFNPVDNGFAGHIAKLTGFKNGENVFHGDRPFRYNLIIVIADISYRKIIVNKNIKESCNLLKLNDKKLY
jgi:hypothetical protein